MGQKLSAIQSVFKFKKNCTMSRNTDDNFVAPSRTNDVVDHESEDGTHDLATTVTIDEDRTSNDHQHFEDIYNSNSDLINDYDQIDGPVMSTAESSSEMKVSGERDDDGFPKTDAFSVNKLKNKLGKKLTQDVSSGKKKKNHWVLKFNCATLKSISSSSIFADSDIPVQDPDADSCVCTRFRRTENQVANESDVSSSLPIFIPKQQLEQLERRESTSRSPANSSQDTGADEGASADLQSTQPFIDLSKFKPEDYPIEDCDERARLERAREIAEGVDPPPGFSPANPEFEVVYNVNLNLDNLKALFQSALSLSALSQIDVPRSVHSQIDYIHCLVPDLWEITSCSFYWGKMDRYEAERLLENKPEGTFLLRDSAQEEHLFSVSFRKYNRSLHARIEQWNHQFSFDSHDPAVFASNTVCGLIGHYKDPTCYMFFEPMLTIPLPRNFPFSLQHLCRAVICDHLTYDSISYLKLPKKLKTYLKEYHYKQRVRVRKFDSEP